jgi:hypothetical protein
MLCLSGAIGATLILATILLASLFHHKPKPKPLTTGQVTLNKEWRAQREYLDRATEGIRAYETDVLYVQYERIPPDVQTQTAARRINHNSNNLRNHGKEDVISFAFRTLAMIDQQIQTTILEEISALRVSFETYTANMELRVSTLETHM